ncbi:LpxL/LpxP family acyltransferase [Methylobacterium haplocladii]|uniref:Lipid A biosynthesis lauroyl acyltransferase n=1 Tax=Methylobacterium haplocladii TaxID=1176176 RepID=A0A512IMM2_9HYPH|nr:hypothetical protein [Methylobacterium haplocladii]GEO98954.1 hypothetical protein MHA02_13420 [Methylobacterium haplocladii]GJD84199.1 hypothetical protein HPGCJGGD_2074 [Methylobacterium haplocladii]
MTAVLQIIKLLGRLPLAARRRALRLLWRGTLPFRSEVGFGLQPVVEHYLKVGRKAAQRIAVEHDYHDTLLIMEWHANIHRSRRQLIGDSARTRVNDPALIERIAASGDTVILAPIHMGVFPSGITHVVWKYFAGRRLLVLRARDDLAENNAAMDRLRDVASEFRILNTRNEADFVDAMRFARKGGVVVSLLDLPETYGIPADTTLFGEPAAIALGLDAMARMLKAVVVPMTVRSLQSRDEIVFGQPFEVSATSPEARQELARAIARQIEVFVKIAPPQWHMWTRLPEFYPERVRRRTPDASPDAGKVEAHVGL